MGRVHCLKLLVDREDVKTHNDGLMELPASPAQISGARTMEQAAIAASGQASNGCHDNLRTHGSL
jgi:hypothetical protein